MTAEPDALRLVPVSLIADTMNWMARAYERIHGLPRISDTDLADKVGAAKERLRPYLDAPAVQPAAGREVIARIIDPAAFLFAPDELPKGSRAQYDAFNKADRILAAISTPAQASGEPVAWRYRWKPTPRSQPGEWREPTNIRWGEEDRTGFEEQPLYAHPPAQASETGGDRWPWLKARVDTLVNILAPDQGEMLTEEGRRLFAIASAIQSDLAALSAPQAAPGEGEQS